MHRVLVALSALPLLLPLLACEAPEPGPGEEAPTTELSYYADIKPMLDTYCTRCHQPGGQGAGDFTDDSVALALAERMRVRVEANEMPPPAADPECRDYHGSERMVLPDSEKQKLADWLDGGAPEGDLADYLAVPTQELTLAEADLELTIEAPYTPEFADPANPGNEYRCFVLEHDRSDAFYVTALAPIVDQPAMVHHIVLFAMPADAIWDDYDPVTGKDCIDGTGGAEIQGMIAGWAPGALPLELDEGMGIRIEADEVLVAQMHYFQSGPDVVGLADQSGYQFRTADEVDTEIRMFPVGLMDFQIPAGDPDYSHADAINLPAGITVTIHTVFPHMHVLGKRYRVWAEDDFSETCIAQGDYDFDNQLSYQLKEPVTVGNGQTLGLECTWDNGASNPEQFYDPPQDIYYGERTDEEMCFAFVLGELGF